MNIYRIVVISLLCFVVTDADAQWNRCYYDGYGMYVCRGGERQPGMYPYQGPFGGREGPAMREEWRRPEFWNWRQGYRGRIRPCEPYPQCMW